MRSSLEFPETALKQYAPKMFRHFLFGLVPTIADICTDMALVNKYLDGSYYLITKNNNGKDLEKHFIVLYNKKKVFLLKSQAPFQEWEWIDPSYLRVRLVYLIIELTASFLMRLSLLLPSTYPLKVFQWPISFVTSSILLPLLLSIPNTIF